MSRICRALLLVFRAVTIVICFLSFQSAAEAGGFLNLSLQGGRMKGRLSIFSEDKVKHLYNRLARVNFYFKDDTTERELQDFTLGRNTTFDYHGYANFRVGPVRMLFSGHANHTEGFGPIWRIHPDDAKKIADGYAAVIDRREWWRKIMPTISLAVLYTLLGAAILTVPLTIIWYRRQQRRNEVDSPTSAA